MSHPWSAVVRWHWLAAAALSAQLQGCADNDDEHPSVYRYDATLAADRSELEPCTVPNQGCPCRNPGEIRGCGKITVSVDGYETCYQGSRICKDAGVWSACEADQVIVDLH